MRLTKWMTVCAIAAIFSLGALASDGHGRSNGNNGNYDSNNGRLVSSLVGSQPSTTVGGVASGGAPWVTRGEALVTDGGELHVEVSGLLIAAGPNVPSNLVGTVGSVKMVGASVVCGGSGGSVAASSDGTPLSSSGDAQIETTVTLPGSCMAPVVLVRIFNASNPIGSQLGPFIALTGLAPGQASNGGHD